MELRSTEDITRAENGTAAENNIKKKKVQKEVRGNWANPVEFFLSCLGYAVGLGNVWRFPYLTYKNGGGAFLIPYLIMWAFCGLPTFFLELALGQYHGAGPNVLFGRLSPIFHGLGYGMLVISFLVVLYYNLIMGWSFFYMYHSFTSKLPWEFCGNEWNTIACYNLNQDLECLKNDKTYWNNTCINITDYCNSFPNFEYFNLTHCRNTSKLPTDPAAFVVFKKVIQRVSPSEDFFSHFMLGITDNIDDLGILKWELVLSLLVAWLVTGLCVIKGIQSSGKVVYFTALFPYVVLIILLIRAATLEGAADGVYFYMVPEFSHLKSVSTWGDAAVQIFYSLGPGFGSLLTLSSYSKFNDNCQRHALMVAVANSLTSIFAGFVIFSILGFMANELEVQVDEVVKSGTGLAFIVYPQAVTRMPISPLWSFLFFFMLILLGLDSQFSMIETLISSIMDAQPHLLKHKSKIVVLLIVVCFLLGLPLCTQGGIYLFTIMDAHASGISILIMGICETVIVAWIYGLDRFSKNVKDMLGKPLHIYWRITWKYISPLLSLGIIIFLLSNYVPVGYGDVVFPKWAILLGWLMTCASLVMIPIFAIYEIIRMRKAKLPWSSLVKPTQYWGPQIGPSLNIDHLMSQKIKDLPIPSSSSLEVTATERSDIPAQKSLSMSEASKNPEGYDNKAFSKM